MQIATGACMKRWLRLAAFMFHALDAAKLFIPMIALLTKFLMS